MKKNRKKSGTVSFRDSLARELENPEFKRLYENMQKIKEIIEKSDLVKKSGNKCKMDGEVLSLAFDIFDCQEKYVEDNFVLSKKECPTPPPARDGTGLKDGTIYKRFLKKIRVL